MFESAGVEEAAGYVVSEVSESEGDAAEVLKSAVDRFGWAVAAVGVGEVGKDVISSAP